ncbi:MAG: hypothetical protein ACXU8U_09615 [Asticcacaulis sp.]
MKDLSVNTKYTLGILFWSALYVATLFIVVLSLKHSTPAKPLLYTLAVLPSLPVGATIWVVLRYMEKSDEYVRAVVTRRFVLATGITLFACTAWGFLESFANAPHFDLYYVYVMFWMSFGVICAFVRGAK